MLRTRALQDETGGFQAFIPLAFHPDNNQMRKLPAPTAADTLRVHAVARLMLDNIPHVKAFWIATGVEVAQTALWFGVDDLDGTVQEEKIYHMAGARTPEALTTARDPLASSAPPAASPSSATRCTTSSPSRVGTLPACRSATATARSWSRTPSLVGATHASPVCGKNHR